MKRAFSVLTHFPINLTDFDIIKENEFSLYVIELLNGEFQSCSPNAFTQPPKRETQESLDCM
jgi:hypothetical protein